MRAAVALVVGLMLTATPAVKARAQSGPPGDGEIRVSRESNIAVTTLTLMLRNASGPLAINLVLTARRDILRPATPAALAMDFNLPVYTGPMSFDTPHYQLRASSSAGELIVAQGNLENRLTMASISVVQVPFDIVRLSQLAGAQAVAGRLFGADFVLTRDQIAAVGAFAERVLKN